MKSAHRVLLLSDDSRLTARLQKAVHERSAVASPARVSEITLVRSRNAAANAIEVAAENRLPYAIALIDTSSFCGAEPEFINRLWACEANLSIIELSSRKTSAEIDERLADCQHPAQFQLLHHAFIYRELLNALERFMYQATLRERAALFAREVERLSTQLERQDEQSRSNETELRRLRLSQLDQMARSFAFGGTAQRDASKRSHSGPGVKRTTVSRPNRSMTSISADSESGSIDRMSRRAVASAETPSLHSSKLQQNQSDAVRLAGRVLVADDVPGNRRLLTFLLENAGASVVTAADGVEVLRLVEESNATEGAFDLILMDMLMPELNGYDCTRRLRGTGHTGPIVAVTARNEPADRQMCLRAGCDDYIAKPIDRNLLIRTVGQLLNQSVAY
jgi:CheY-like chemotaxis protein